jgi:hypothetical protein
MRILGLASILLLCATPVGAQQPAGAPEPVYPTYGVHNAPSASPCANSDCIYVRKPGEPSNPIYPDWWSSHWIMYRVFKNYAEFPPPYAGKPPSQLKEGADYETSYGATYYDSTWTDGTRHGAMMEHYEKHCLPIFPIGSNFTCSFISLGETAFFVTYPEDRPKDMPPVCLFSPRNHPPASDFIKHLPYAAGDSVRLQNEVQGYSFWISGKNGKPVQTGVSPDRTARGDVLFGYAFESLERPDASDPAARPYRHPQSFYFSGSTFQPPDAPIVSQNYTDFAMVKPDPAATWDQVDKLDPTSLPPCQLFTPPLPQATKSPGHPVGSWAGPSQKQ